MKLALPVKSAAATHYESNCTQTVCVLMFVDVIETFSLKEVEVKSYLKNKYSSKAQICRSTVRKYKYFDTSLLCLQLRQFKCGGASQTRGWRIRPSLQCEANTQVNVSPVQMSNMLVCVNAHL